MSGGTGATGGTYYLYQCVNAHLVEGHSKEFMFYSAGQKCEACQFLSKQHHLPAQQLQTIPVTWPFACWGLDMIGPFKKA